MYLGSRRWRIYQNGTLVFDAYMKYDDAIAWTRDFNASTEELDDELYIVRKDR